MKHNDLPDYSIWDLARLNIAVPGNRFGLYGPPGTGKTNFATTFMDDQFDVFVFTATEDMEMPELRGFTDIHSGEWMMGIVTHAWENSWKKPTRLVINEIDRLEGDSESFIHAAVEDPSRKSTQMILPNRQHTIVRPHPTNLQIIATMNEHPKNLKPALADRFRWFEILDIHPDSLLGLPEQMREVAAATCNIRDLKRRFSLRDWYSYATFLEHGMEDWAAQLSSFGPERADEVRKALSIKAGKVADVMNRDGAIINPQFDQDYSSWEDADTWVTCWCFRHGVEDDPANHNGYQCKPVRFRSAQEAHNFLKEYDVDTISEMQKQCLKLRTRSKSTAAIETLIEEWT